jgi:hypothetical protein
VISPGGAEGAFGYTIPNLLIDHAMRNPHIPPHFWRGVATAAIASLKRPALVAHLSLPTHVPHRRLRTCDARGAPNWRRPCDSTRF